MDNEGNIPEFPDIKIAQECFETSPWVRVNLKKVPGASSITNQTLAQYIQEFRPLLLNQLYIGG